MYSSGVTLQALGVPVRRWGAVIIDTVVCAVVTGIVLFHGNFYADFAGFLLYIVVWLAPWFGILITDYLLRGRQYDSLSLRSSRGGLYWRNGGIHWPAVIAQVVGMVAALLWINAAFAIPAVYRPDLQPLPRPGRRGLQLGDRHRGRSPALLGARRARRPPGSGPDDPHLTRTGPAALGPGVTSRRTRCPPGRPVILPQRVRPAVCGTILRAGLPHARDASPQPDLPSQQGSRASVSTARGAVSRPPPQLRRSCAHGDPQAAGGSVLFPGQCV